MAFFVIGDQGQKYGPADIQVLNAWIAEGRVATDTVLEDEVLGHRFPANAVPGLLFPMAPTQQYSPYPRYTQPMPFQAHPFLDPRAVQANSSYQLACAMAVTSAILFLLCTILMPITAGIGIGAAIKARNLGHPSAGLLLALNIVALIVPLAILGGAFLLGCGR